MSPLELCIRLKKLVSLSHLSLAGAKAYYFRAIFHDWDDENCRKILRNQIPAMSKGYSKLLLNERVMPDTKASYFVAGMDIVMMTMLSGMQRTRSQWHSLLESEGFRLVGIWPFSEDTGAIIEAELKE